MTPYYLLEEKLLRRNLELIKHVADTAGVEIILAFKAYALWKTFPVFRAILRPAALMRRCFPIASLAVWLIPTVLPIPRKISLPYWIVADI